MWDKAVINMILVGIGETLYMTLASTIMGYVFGMPLGIALAVTDKTGIRPNAVVYKILDFISNIIRSIPFLILLIVLIPFTRLVVGKSYGSTATIVPLVVAATPFIGRMVESSLKEVDGGVIEAAQSMYFYNYFQSIAGRGKNIHSCRCYYRNRYNTWLFCHGRYCRRRRSWRYRYSLRISSLSGRYYGCNSDSVDRSGADIPDNRHAYCQ